MANYPAWYAYATFRDGANRPASVEFRVPEATAKTFFAAADKAARDATAIGLFFVALGECTLLTLEKSGVRMEDQESPYTLPAESALRGNKIVVGYLTGADNRTFTIPGRDPASYTPNSDEISIDITADGDFKDFLTLAASVVLGHGGLAITPTMAYVND